jgi:hypothetical protein
MGSSTNHNNKLTNGAILIISKVLKHVMSSTAEEEIGAVFINAKEGAVLNIMSFNIKTGKQRTYLSNAFQTRMRGWVKKYQQYLQHTMVIKPVSTRKPSRDQSASIRRVLSFSALPLSS